MLNRKRWKVFFILVFFSLHKGHHAMIISLDYNDKIFIQKETSENENRVIRPEFVRWEGDCSQWAAVKVMLILREREAFFRHTTQSVLWNFGKGQFNKTRMRGVFINKTWRLKTYEGTVLSSIPHSYSPKTALLGPNRSCQGQPQADKTAQRANYIPVTLCPKESPLLTQLRRDEAIPPWLVMRDRSRSVFTFSPEGWPIVCKVPIRTKYMRFSWPPVHLTDG